MSGRKRSVNHGINRLDDAFLGVYVKSEMLGAVYDPRYAQVATAQHLGFLISRIHLGPIV